MFCINCGGKLKDGVAFCKFCGTRIAVVTPEEPVAPQPVIPAPVPEPVIPEPVIPEPVIPEPVIPEPVPEPIIPEPVPEQIIPEPVPEPIIPEPAPEPVIPEPAREPYIPTLPFPEPAPAPVYGQAAYPNPELIQPGPKKPGRNKGLLFLLTLLYIGAVILLILLPDMSDTVLINTDLGEDFSENMTLKEFTGFLTNGNSFFYPTVLSVAWGLGVDLLIWTTLAFAVVAMIGTLAGKGGNRLCAAFSVVAAVTGVAMALLVPMTNLLVPNLRQGVAVELDLRMDDVTAIEGTTLIIMGAVALILAVIVYILSANLNRRNKK